MEGKLWHFLTVSFALEVQAARTVLNYLGSTESQWNSLYVQFA